MNITSLNSNRFVSFSGDDSAKLTTTGKVVLSVAGAATLAGLVLSPNLTNDVFVPSGQSTVPSSGYVENVEISDKIISTLPQDQREAVWHTVEQGDTLGNIVRKYADVDPSVNANEYGPYYDILKQDNPGKLDDINTIKTGEEYRVDGIMPQNIIILSDSDYQSTEPVNGDEDSSLKEIVEVNGNSFYFDEGSLKRTFFGDFQGLMSGRYASINLTYDGMELKKYEGVSSSTNLSQKFLYDGEGRITEFTEYKNNKPSSVYSYEYRENSTIEKYVDKSAKTGQINTIISEFDKEDDFVMSRQFLVGDNIVANFNFVGKTVKIGENVWKLDELQCNDDVIGSKRYVGIWNGQNIEFDTFKNGFFVYLVDEDGTYASRQLFDSYGSLDSVE